MYNADFGGPAFGALRLTRGRHCRHDNKRLKLVGSARADIVDNELEVLTDFVDDVLALGVDNSPIWSISL